MKKAWYILFLLTLMAMLAGCDGKWGGDSASEEAAAAPDGEVQQTLSITEISDESVVSHEVILPYAERADGQENQYYYTAAYEGKYVYWVIRASDEQRVAVPVSETTVYYTDAHAGYIEQVAFAYTTSDGEKHDVTQYRLVVSGDTEEAPVDDGGEGSES